MVGTSAFCSFLKSSRTHSCRCAQTVVGMARICLRKKTVCARLFSRSVPHPLSAASLGSAPCPSILKQLFSGVKACLERVLQRLLPILRRTERTLWRG